MSDQAVSRKEFLRRTWRGILGFAGELVAGAVDTLDRLVPQRIRPPGAVESMEFLAKCLRCGSCIRACPHFALREVLDRDAADFRTPHLVPRQSPCRWCDDFPCIQACPSGALKSEAGKMPTRIAVARVDPGLCLRKPDVDCRGCGGRCPVGINALMFPAEGSIPEVSSEICIGCGACEAGCPVQPSSAIRCETL